MNENEYYGDHDCDFSEEEEEFIKETELQFEKFWSGVKADVRELSKKDLARQMFVSGVLMYKQFVDEEMQKHVKFMEEHPEEIEKMIKEEAACDGGFWEDGAFAESMNAEEAKEREKTIHMKHDENMNFNCKSCNAKISAHNKDWHAEMCDECFNKMYFPGKQKNI